MRALSAGGIAVIATVLFSGVPSAHAAVGGVQRTNYMVGPFQVTPGQNRISYAPITEKPQVDGWITRIKPNLVRADGSVPSTDQVMFHHGVWLNTSRQDATSRLPERFFATGEEKTILKLPPGYGYRFNAGDGWLLNHMIHNLTPRRMQLYISYQIDFIPDSAPAAKAIRPVRPVWMDVANGSVYPVFDVLRGSGGKDGEFTYPDDAKNPYPDGRRRNTWRVDRDGVLVATAGHVHTGGLRTDLWLRRRGKRAHLFRSKARYFEPAGPVSWDVAMTATRPGWRVAVKRGDTLGISATYDTRRASWYESMGIMVVYMAGAGKGANPYTTKVDRPGRVTHGHLHENDNHGGKRTGLPDPRRLPSGPFSPGPLSITGFVYGAGDLNAPGAGGRPPVVKQGQSLTYVLSQQDASQEIWHSLTSCRAPCNRSTGIAYPIPDGRYTFDSGQLGTHTPAVGRVTWQTPPNLPVGTYTYFCRIHPFMRGAFRVRR